jgi:hypothetical protein
VLRPPHNRLAFIGELTKRINFFQPDACDPSKETTLPYPVLVEVDCTRPCKERTCHASGR